MQIKNSVRAITLVGVITGVAGLASAADYDESIDGDLAGLAAGGTFFNLDVGTNTVTGSVGVGGAIEEDFVTFNIGAGQQLASVILTAVNFTGGNTSTGFRLYTDQGSGFFQASPGSFSAADVGVDYLTVWDLSDVGGSAPLGPGTYGIILAEFTANQGYSFQINVVPTPGVAAVLGLGGLALGRRRR